MIDKGIVCACRDAFAVGQRVLAHVLISQTSDFGERTNRTLEYHGFPSKFEKPLIVRITWVAAHKVRIRTCPVDTDHVC